VSNSKEEELKEELARYVAHWVHRFYCEAEADPNLRPTLEALFSDGAATKDRIYAAGFFMGFTQAIRAVAAGRIIVPVSTRN
jgi:hypothetical protein